MADGLTPKQERFVQEYMIDLNATQAAIRAGYSEDTAGQIGFEILKKPEVSASLQTRLAERAKSANIDAQWVLDRLAEEARADVADLYDDDGRIKPVKEWPKIWRQGLVAGVKTMVSEDGVAIIDVKLSDRIKRIELLGKHVRVNAFQEVVQHKGLEGLADRIERASKRGG